MRRRNLIWLSAVAAVLTAGCSPDATAPRAAPAVQTSNAAPSFWETGASLYWNGVALDLVVKYKSSPFAAVRGLALLSNAQYQSTAASLGTTGKTRPSTTAAVARASAVALAYLYPAETSALDALVTEELSSPDWPGDKGSDIASGDAIGRAIAQQLVSDATTDRFFAAWTGTVPTGPGIWFSTSTPPAPPVGAMFGLARTYYMTSGDQFRPPPPPAFGSPEYLDALHEVRQVSDTRTAEQLANALYWALPGGTVTPPGFWNVEAANLVAQYRLSELAASHVLAVINKTGFDAIVACHDAKFFYWLIRPTQADPNINLAVALPNFPSYPSDHACVSGAMTAVLGSFFPAEKTRLDALAEEAARSRLEGGLHYRFDNETGLRLGRQVAGLALSIEGPGRH
ncbi:MAG TPA: vanadium-dependent haloperoxidase [Gemmatimonadaceae bacterium]|nr:vanadium-dependent haloperoxidase [Gemmatimonadaceae bacterium]